MSTSRGMTPFDIGEPDEASPDDLCLRLIEQSGPPARLNRDTEGLAWEVSAASSAFTGALGSSSTAVTYTAGGSKWRG